MKPKLTLLPKCFGCCSKGPLIDLLWPFPGSAPGQISPKSQYKCAGHEYFIPTKFVEYPSRGSLVKADYVFQYIYMYMHCAPPPPHFFSNNPKIH